MAAYITLDAYGRHRQLEQARYDACNPQDSIDPSIHLAKMKALGFPVKNELEYSVNFMIQQGYPDISLKALNNFMDKVCAK